MNKLKVEGRVGRVSNNVYEFRVRRVRRSFARDRGTVNDPRSAASIFYHETREEPRECFMTVLIDARNNIVGFERVATGGLAGVDVHPREVFRAAILAGAAAIVAGHNHPSGNPTPSAEDIDLTKRLVKSGEILGIPVLDHIVVAEGRTGAMRYESLAELELLTI